MPPAVSPVLLRLPKDTANGASDSDDEAYDTEQQIRALILG